MDADFWNERYSENEYVYGTEANVFFKEQLLKLKPGKILLPADGEGRNAVFAAKMGWDTFAFDISERGKEKATKLAESNNVKINYEISTYENYKSENNSFDAIAFIYTHFDDNKKEKILRNLLRYLKTGGTLIMEVFSKEQIQNLTGGPRNAEFLFSEKDLEYYFRDFKEFKIEKLNVNLSEGDFHNGESSVIRLIGTK